ncbi:aminotransferase class I/II-fold pyridoxal phosphate-dependent enzyme [Marispirochaeta aestuarii]|uniref:DegT/DnrJ/EryC1/StrS family aminotransferase n=1 Tax=Marispirochaeta aestuarii TaxID=1963862 RepID=UPI002ABE98BE|nr:aminotransferase class I/II-fold pyridoxal phosphate-dependent enzyme [Marispirochaeta aestuarii]
MKYPIYQPFLNGNEKKYVNDALDSTWISSRGLYIEKFETACASLCNVSEAIAVANGTVALHLVLLAAGIKPGDSVIVPDLTYVASANAVLYCGADVKLVDVEPDSWNISNKALIEAIDDTVKAVIITDLYGVPAVLDKETKEYLINKDIKIIEDAAEAIGSYLSEEPAGSLGEFGVFSFFGNKTITTGEGGMILSHDSESASLLRKLRNQGNSEKKRYFHDILGYNYRMTNIQAAIGVAQLEQLSEIIEKKRRIFKWYEYFLEEKVKFQVVPNNCNVNHWLVSVLLPSNTNPSIIANRLLNSEIETRPVFIPISEMPYMEKAETPVSHDISMRGISLPSYPDLQRKDVESICSELINCMEQ